MTARLRVLDNGTLREITRLYVKQAGILRRIKTLKVKDGGTLRLVGKFADPLSVSIPTPAAGAGFAPPGTPTQVAAGTTAIASGGLPPYTYAWARVSGDTFTIGSPTSASTSFSSILTAPDTESGVYRVTATDALGDTATADTTVTLILNQVGP